jgi:peptidyl-prolyl cis-trans isomerase B (cyclophilin B)
VEAARSAASPVRPTSRSANRAAKRAASGRPPAGTGRGARRSRGTSWAIVGLGAAAAVVAAGVILIGNPFGTATPGRSADLAACPTSQPPSLPAGESRLVTIETDLGDIVIKVDGALSPIAAGNFVALAECGFYDGVVFHRTAALANGTPFVIQGGDPDGTGRGGPGYTIKDEPVTATYHRGTVAMARSQGVDTQGSQFFIVLDDGSGPTLASANTYAIFGEVVSGMDVADAIFEASGGQETPADPVVMNFVTVSDAPAASASPAASTGASAAPTTSAGPVLPSPSQ